ncbi:MAG: class I SAM-dependent methyltransferase [Desulfobacterales bacterium]|nr:class I SAM-dependent methyltransferase [Desulfobacterales bacterium]
MENQKLKISFPKVDSANQGSGEYFFIEKNGKKEKVTFHEYDKIYSIPGLYEGLFYDKLKCNSPAVVGGLINKYYQKNNLDTSDLNILDIGAGNGIMGEELKNIGVNSITGLDIIEEAESSAMRDRPDVYTEYYTADLLDLSDPHEVALTNAKFNGMTIVAALGFDDIPAQAFAAGYNYVSSPGLFAFNIKEDFIAKKDHTGFSKLINDMVDEDILDIKEKHRYQHRLCQDGTPLYYYAIVAEKKDDIPDKMLEQFA